MWWKNIKLTVIIVIVCIVSILKKGSITQHAQDGPQKQLKKTKVSVIPKEG